MCQHRRRPDGNCPAHTPACNCNHQTTRVPTLLTTHNISRPVLSQRCISTDTNSSYIYGMIAASMLEYRFITVTCCKETVYAIIYTRCSTYVIKPPGKTAVCVCSMYTSYCSKKFRRFPAPASMRPQHCLANSTTFQNSALRFPGLSRTKLILQDFPCPENFTNTIPGLSRRRGNPEQQTESTWEKPLGFSFPNYQFLSQVCCRYVATKKLPSLPCLV